VDGRACVLCCWQLLNPLSENKSVSLTTVWCMTPLSGPGGSCFTLLQLAARVDRLSSVAPSLCSCVWHKSWLWLMLLGSFLIIRECNCTQLWCHTVSVSTPAEAAHACGFCVDKHPGMCVTCPAAGQVTLLSSQQSGMGTVTLHGVGTSLRHRNSLS
jgi:hypothetical protein